MQATLNKTAPILPGSVPPVVQMPALEAVAHLSMLRPFGFRAHLGQSWVRDAEPSSLDFRIIRRLQDHRGLSRELVMCRNIRTLHNFLPPATDDEVRASAIQFVRKLSSTLAIYAA